MKPPIPAKFLLPISTIRPLSQSSTTKVPTPSQETEQELTLQPSAPCTKLSFKSKSKKAIYVATRTASCSRGAGRDFNSIACEPSSTVRESSCGSRCGPRSLATVGYHQSLKTRRFTSPGSNIPVQHSTIQQTDVFRCSQPTATNAQWPKLEKLGSKPFLMLNKFIEYGISTNFRVLFRLELS